MEKRKIPEQKPEFKERMQELLGKEYNAYCKILETQPVKSIRCNTLKISPRELKKKLEEKGWKIIQPWKNHPEIMIIDSALEPGEIGRALEHLLGYYYMQELASMLPPIALSPKENQKILDLAAAPGSKTTQLAAIMKNTGTIIANDISVGRIKILASNLERIGATNTIITRKDGIAFCKRLKNQGFQFDKILVDAPCSGEGTLRSSHKTYEMWNIKTVKALPKIQIALVSAALEILKAGGALIYSTCTHSPEENEGVVDSILKTHDVSLQEIKIPIKARPGITEWQGKKYSKEVTKCARIYPQDNNTEGFFLSKFIKK
ncbi:MAG: RsmB/NOP family class I SAM-dependent RNA methyltransferase [Nanoarchaeota archaeon]|nr:RsmB/NOP family class I SAM-dependent RNA methyltransferase [Nanoarchaeota archaeon]